MAIQEVTLNIKKLLSCSEEHRPFDTYRAYQQIQMVTEYDRKKTHENLIPVRIWKSVCQSYRPPTGL